MEDKETLESRLDAIRDRRETADRVVAIARDLRKYGQRELEGREYTWLDDELFHGDRIIPFLQPVEYDALIRALLSDAKQYRFRCAQLRESFGAAVRSLHDDVVRKANLVLELLGEDSTNPRPKKAPETSAKTL